MRVAFAGTPEFAASALQAIHAAGHEVPLVLTQPDRPAGRGMKLQASAVKQAAQRIGAPLAQPRGLRLDGRYADDAAAARAVLEAARPEVMVVAAYGLILPRWVLELPPRGCLNIHASLLPRWRGAAPIQRALEAGDAETGITIMQMDEGLDTGAMLATRAIRIGRDDTAATLHDRLAALGAEMIVATLAAPATPVPQPDVGVTYAHKIAKEEAPIDWRLPAAALDGRIRAFDPFPGATCVAAGQTLKVWRAEPVPAHGAPGTVLGADEHGLLVACGDAALRLTVLQRAGGRRLPAVQALQGLPLRAGDRLA